MRCKYRVMDKCRAKDNIEDAFCFGKDGCPYYENEVEAIPKDQYENRLKADMVAMLEDLDLQIDESAAYNLEVAKVQRLIRDKINALKEDKDANND